MVVIPTSVLHPLPSDGSTLGSGSHVEVQSPQGRSRPRRRLHPPPRGPPEQPEELRPRYTHPATRRRHRSQRLRQEFPRLRHPLRRRTAPLHRDLLPLRTPVLRSDGQAGRRPYREHPARHRHRAAQRRSNHPLYRWHDDRGLRPHEGPVGAPLEAPLPSVWTGRPARTAPDGLVGDRGSEGGCRDRHCHRPDPKGSRSDPGYVRRHCHHLWRSSPARRMPHHV